MKCAHSSCDCEGVAAFDGYCSSHCAEVDRRPGATQHQDCQCGHPPCGENRP